MCTWISGDTFGAQATKAMAIFRSCQTAFVAGGGISASRVMHPTVHVGRCRLSSL